MRTKLVVVIAFVIGLVAGLAYRPYQIVVTSHAVHSGRRPPRPGEPSGWRYKDEIVRVNRFTGETLEEGEAMPLFGWWPRKEKAPAPPASKYDDLKNIKGVTYLDDEKQFTPIPYEQGKNTGYDVLEPEAAK